MTPSRPSRDHTFMHALGFYHIGEALDHARSAEDFEAFPSPRTSPTTSLRSTIASLTRWIVRHRPSFGHKPTDSAP